MVRALFPTLAVVAALATTAQAQSYEILRSDCNGQVSFMEKTIFETRGEIYPTKQIFEHLKVWMTNRAKAACGSDWSDDQLDILYNPVSGGVGMVDSLSDQGTHKAAKCRDKLGFFNFDNIFDMVKADLDFDKLVQEVAKLEDEHKKNMNNIDKCTHTGYLRVLPTTCSAASLKAGKGCAFQIPLKDIVGTDGFNLNFAVNICPKSMLPFFSLRISGPGAKMTLAPCAGNGDCGKNQKCIDLAGGKDGLDGTIWQKAAEGFAEMLFSGDLVSAMVSFDTKVAGWDKRKGRIMDIVKKHDMGTQLMMIIRSYYDSKSLKLGQNQVMPMCFPEGKISKWQSSSGFGLSEPSEPKLQSPVKGKPNLEFEIKGKKYKCDKAASIEKSDSKWSTDSTSKTEVKCVSAKIEGFAPVLNLFTSRKNLNADGTKCEVVTLVEVLDGLYAWDAAKEGIFDSKIMSAEPIAKDRKNSWFQWDCEGRMVAKFAKNIYAAVQIPALSHVADAFTDLARTVVLEDAKAEKVCVIDEQVMAYFMPWELDFWLNLATGWGKGTPELLPKLPSSGQAAGELMVKELKNKPLTLTTPGTCTAAGYPENGCGMNYDLSWAANKQDIGVDLHIKKCHRNPIGLADVHVACTSKDKLCDYGRNWCTTKDNKCSNKKDKCYPFTDKELLSTFIALEMTDNRKCPFENEALYKKEQAACIKTPCTQCAPCSEWSDDEHCYNDFCEGERYRKAGTDCSTMGGFQWMDSTYRTKWPYSPQADPLSYLMGVDFPFGENDYDGFLKSTYAKEDYAKAFECIGDGSNKNVWCTGQKKCVKNAKPGACTSCKESTQNEPKTMGCKINGTQYEVYQGWADCSKKNKTCGDFSDYNTKVKAGNLKLEMVNLLRELFGDIKLDSTENLGYCAPNLDALEDSTEDTDKLMEELITVKETDKSTVVSLSGLTSATVPSDMGKSGLPNAAWQARNPGYRKETCGLVSVNEITVPAAADVAGRVPRDTYMSALQDNLPKGAEASVTSYSMSLESDFTLPAGTKVPEGDELNQLRKDLSKEFDVSVNQVEIEGSGRRRRLQSETKVKYKVTSTSKDGGKLAKTSTLPTTDKVLQQVAKAAGVGKDKLNGANPQAAAVKTAIKYTVKMLASAGKSGDDLEKALKDSKKIQASLEKKGVKASVSASSSKAVVNKKTTTKTAASSAGLTSQNNQPAPPPPGVPPPPPTPSATSTSATSTPASSSAVAVVAPLAMPLWAAGATLLLAIELLL